MSRRSIFRAVSALASSAVLLGAGSAVADAAVQAHAAGASVTVSAVEFKFKMSATSESKPGPVTFKITNNGKLPHDFKIDGKESKMLQPGQSTSLAVTLKKGSYPYLCTVPGHAAAGMKGTFKVA